MNTAAKLWFLIMLSLLQVTLAQASGGVFYTGDSIQNPVSNNSGFAYSANSFGGSASASASIILNYEIPKVVTLDVYDVYGNNSDDPLLASETNNPPPSVLRHVVTMADIDNGNIDNIQFAINAVAYSNAGSIGVLVSSTSAQDPDTFTLSNGVDSIRVDVNGTTTVDSATTSAYFPLNTLTYFPISQNTGRARFTVLGRVDPNSLTSDISPGEYTGSVTLSVSAP